MPTTTPVPPPSRVPGFSPDGIVRVGFERRRFGDLYHLLLQASWLRVLLLMASLYFTANVVFACLYLIGGDCIRGAEPGSVRDAFFFSLQTLATIGYGVMAPRGMYANVVVTVESFTGLLSFAMASGLMFSKFSRPTARVLFAQNMVIAPRNGVPCLMMRMTNGRSNEVVEASVRLSVLKTETTLEGEQMKRVYDLHLVRNQSPLFTMSWMVMHLIDEASPIYEDTEASLRADAVRFIVTFTGIDGTFAQTVHSRHSYEARDVIFGARFANMITPLGDGRVQIDYSRIHEVEHIAARAPGDGGESGP